MDLHLAEELKDIAIMRNTAAREGLKYVFDENGFIAELINKYRLKSIFWFGKSFFIGDGVIAWYTTANGSDVLARNIKSNGIVEFEVGSFTILCAGDRVTKEGFTTFDYQLEVMKTVITY